MIETVCRDEVSVKAAMSSGAAVVDLGARFLFPGLIDCHAHAPQYAQLGLGTDLPLLEWLEKYTFPTEAKFADPTFARRVYADAVSRALSNGTTTCLWFGSQHLAATKVLADVCYEKGFHGFVGKVRGEERGGPCACHHVNIPHQTCMDRNSPDFYVEASAEASLRDALELVRYVQGLKSPTVTPIITPRFAISCTPQLMTGLGKLAREHNLMIQSHISENEGEIAFVKSLHPESKHYADVYHSHGLLTDRTVMAHACHLLDDEVALLASTGASVAHCPNSNFTLCSGIAPVRKYLRAGIKVGLSTDMSGGYAHSMWEAMRAAMYCSAAVHSVHPEVRGATRFPPFFLGSFAN